MKKALRIGVAGAVCSYLSSSALAQAVPEVGWWWNPEQSGRGYFIESRRGVTYFAGYFYGSDGAPVWAIAGGPNADPSRYQGQLLAFSQGQTLLGAYKAPATPTSLGAISLSFSDSRNGTMTWPGGTVSLRRMEFGSGKPPFQPATGLWWNPAESGTGYNLEVQGDKLFVNAFVYDETGNPVWYLSAGTMTSAAIYEGAWLRFVGGQTMSGSYRPPGAPVEVARIRIEFLGDDAAELTFTGLASLAEVATKVQPQRAILVQPLVEPERVIAFPERFEGSFHFELTFETPDQSTRRHVTISSDSLELKERTQGGANCEPEANNPCTRYVAPVQDVDVVEEQRSPFLGGTCVGRFSGKVALAPHVLMVDVYANQRYELTFRSSTSDMSWPYIQTCTSPLPPYTFPFPQPGVLTTSDAIRKVDVLHDGNIEGFALPRAVALGRTVEGNWNFSKK